MCLATHWKLDLTKTSFITRPPCPTLTGVWVTPQLPRVKVSADPLANSVWNVWEFPFCSVYEHPSSGGSTCQGTFWPSIAIPSGLLPSPLVLPLPSSMVVLAYPLHTWELSIPPTPKAILAARRLPPLGPCRDVTFSITGESSHIHNLSLSLYFLNIFYLFIWNVLLLQMSPLPVPLPSPRHCPLNPAPAPPQAFTMLLSVFKDIVKNKLYFKNRTCIHMTKQKGSHVQT